MTEAITWTNERRRLGDLKPQPDNPRQLRKEQAKRLDESLRDYGQVETVAIGPDGEIYNGHQRLAVLLEKHGPDYEIDVRVSSRPLEHKEWQRLTVLLHQGTIGEWDFGELANWDVDFGELTEWGFDDKELAAAFGVVPDFAPVDESEQPRLDEKAPITCPECGAVFVPK